MKLKLKYADHLMRRTDSLEKTLMQGKTEGRREGDSRGWDGWMESLTWWTWVWESSGSWSWTGKPGMLQSMGSQRVGHDWETEFNRTIWSKILLLDIYSKEMKMQSWRDICTLMFILSVMPPNYIILCCPLLLSPSIFPNIKVFSNVSVLCIRRPKYWSFNFSISPSHENSGLISFRIDWLIDKLIMMTSKF